MWGVRAAGKLEVKFAAEAPSFADLIAAQGPLAVFSGQVLSFLSFCVCVFVMFPVPEPSKEVGDVFKCIGDVFCIELAFTNG